MPKTIAHNQPTLGPEEAKVAAQVLKSGWLAEGKQVEKFEDEFCRFLKVKSGQAVAVSSGTAALYVSLISLKVGAGDEVIVPSYVCSAVLNAVYLAQAKPVLVDINSDDFNISFTKTKAKINPKTKAVIVPHTFGLPADIDKFMRLGVPIIEDCAQAIGAKFKGKLVGTFGQAAIFSFYASKMLTTGYGGMIFSKDKKFIGQVKDFREFDCRQYYKLRFNFQMSDLQAAIGRVQLKKLPSFLTSRKKIASQYYKALPAGKVWPRQKFNAKQSNFYRFLVRTNQPTQLKRALADQGISTIIPIQTYELLHRYLKQKPNDFPVTEDVAQTTLSLPIYPSLTSAEVNRISKSIKQLL